MSRKLLNKIKHRRSKKAVVTRDWRLLVVLPVWVLVSFFAAQLLVEVLLAVAQLMHVDVASFGPEAVIQAALSALVYALALGIAIGGPYIVYKQRPSRDILGVKRLMTWSDIGLAPLTYLAYILMLLFVLTLISSLIPGFNGNEVQDVGFRNLTTQSGYVLAFITLVVVAPIAEETLFRGYLYGRLRLYVPIWAAALATSILFGAVHGQWNVGVDTFVLSLFLCGLRELTGNIWAGILVHMLKNAIAFYIMFLAPFLMMGG